MTATFSFNSEPYVANSSFKNVSNYSNSDLKKANFASLNFKSNFGPIEFILEGEAGYSLSADMIPLYSGLQFGIPVTKNFDFKPRFFYYGALDKLDSEKSRQTFEIYPRIWLNFGKWNFMAGYDFDFKQSTKDNWNFEWSLPVLVEYKF